MPQTQKQIALQFIDGSSSQASATGNNAAWLCACGLDRPLIGRSGSTKGASENTRVTCPQCNRSFFVVPDAHDQDRAVEVIELATA